MKRHPPPNTTAGLSLIELVIAMAVFAMVAVMGLQSLTGTMRISERLTEIDAQTAELGTAIGLLRNDLGAIVPISFYPPQGRPEPAVALSEDGLELGLSVAGQKALTPAHTNRHRAEWVFDPEKSTLSRRFWPTLLPAAQNQQSPEMLVLDGVTALTLRTFWPGVGWISGTTPPFGNQVSQAKDTPDQDKEGVAPPVYVSNLPVSVEVTVQTEAQGDVRFVQTLK